MKSAHLRRKPNRQGRLPNRKRCRQESSPNRGLLRTPSLSRKQRGGRLKQGRKSVGDMKLYNFASGPVVLDSVAVSTLTAHCLLLSPCHIRKNSSLIFPLSKTRD